MLNSKKTAIVCDWLIDFGGAELVISHLLELFPEADIYASVCFMDHPMLKGHKIYTSWIAKIPYLNRKHKLAGILRPWAFRSFDLSGYDVVICSSSAESKQVAMGKWRKSFMEGQNDRMTGQKDRETCETVNLGNCKSEGPQVIVYCHTPTRYYWSHAKEYEDMMEFGILNPLVKAVFRLVKGWMQRLDYEAAQKVDFFIANSENTRERIKKYYDRESEVIYPGVSIPLIRGTQGVCSDDSETNPPTPLIRGTLELNYHSSDYPAIRPSDYYLGLGRCIPYKRFDLLVDAFNANGKKLILCTATDTPLFRELKAKSKPNIEWRFRISDEEKYELMTHAKAFLFPPEEDFGLVPVEAMMLGTPVIAYGKGGALESVIEGETGVFFTPQTPEALNGAIKRFENMNFDPLKIQEHAGKFSKEAFQKKMVDFVNSKI